LYRNFGVTRNAPLITGVSKTVFQAALQSTSMCWFRHQSGPPPARLQTRAFPPRALDSPSGRQGHPGRAPLP
jgi:hypothetical protein